jgi:hypothetical protein
VTAGAGLPPLHLFVEIRDDGTERHDRSDDDGGDEGDEQAVFDRGRASLDCEKSLEEVPAVRLGFHCLPLENRVGPATFEKTAGPPVMGFGYAPSLLLMLVKAELIWVPRVTTTATMTAAMRATSMPYSTAVAPRSS